MRIVTGPGTPTRLTALIARLSNAIDPDTRLRIATHHLTLETSWPRALLDDLESR